MTGKVPEIVRWSLLSLQVCVPEEYTDEAVTEFANKNQPTGLDHDWQIKTDYENPANIRVPCESRRGCVHVVLTC